MRLIDADALKEFIGTYDGTTAQVEAVEVKYIDNAPTVLHDNYSMGYQDGVKKVLSERPTGEWINGVDKCPCCGKSKFEGLDADIWADWQPKFCPNCGAEMVKS